MQKTAPSETVEFISLLTSVKNQPSGRLPRQDCDPLVDIWRLRTAIYLLTNPKSDELGRRDLADIVTLTDRDIYDKLLGDQDCDAKDSFSSVLKCRDACNEIPLEKIIAGLRETRERKERRLAGRYQDALSLNVSRLGKLLGLSRVDQALLFFLAKTESDSLLRESLEDRKLKNFRQAVSMLAHILNIPQRDIKKALDTNSLFHQTGIAKIDRTNFRDYTDLADVIKVGDVLTNLLLCEYETEKEFLETLLQRSAPPRLSSEDFAHVRQEYQLALEYLKAASEKNQAGVNVLVYGKPGVGKTEMARSLCAELGLQLYEVPSEKKLGLQLYEVPSEKKTARRGGAILKEERLSSCTLTDRLLAGTAGSVLLFDEIEDVFSAKLSFFQSDDPGKAWTNRLLEQNATPIIWISNSVWQIDPAFIRRFDIVLHLRQPNPATRHRMLDEMLAGAPTSEAWRSRMANCRNLAPAHVERAVKVTGAVLEKKGASEELAESTLETLLKNILEAQGETLMPTAPAASMTTYDPTLLNADADLQALVAGLQKHRQGRLCFYGPPGTGKTAFAHHLAEAVEKPLLVKRLDEILSCWVGETEKHVAATFREAESEDAVLLLDEADSLLHNRRNAVRSWEVTKVNQMLTCMEHFDGIFIASTNLADGLDEASLRRFDCKIHFNTLKPDQAWRLFLSALAQSNLALSRQEAESLGQRLRRLHNLTPGDYNTTLRKQRLLTATPSPLQLLEALEQECAIKPDSPRPIGFIP